ncbi:phage tail assembly chaperone [Bradyrhizobium cosmicum]
MFLRLNARRSAGFSLEPISFSEIESFTRLSGLRLSPFEVRLIEDLDNLFRAVHLTEKS